jgi:putative membrane protein insertion efficiency factor
MSCEIKVSNEKSGMKKHYFLVAFTAFLFFNKNVFSQDSNNNSFIDYLKVYQKNISHIRPDECAMYPSCSNYSINSFKTHNAFKAMVLTSDRLLRCGHDHKNYLLAVNNSSKIKLYDPVINSKEERENLLAYPVLYFSYYDKTKNDSLKFISSLINDHLYEQALLEIKRMMFTKENDSLPIALFANYIICRNALNQQEEILFDYETTFPESIKASPEIIYLIAGTWFRLDNYTKAMEVYSDVINKSGLNTDIKLKSNLMKAVCNSRINNWQQSLLIIEQPQNQDDYLLQTKKNIITANEAFSFKKKKPVTAAILGIIPGAGYLYTGHKQTALSALIVNGLLGWATFSNIKKENYGMAALTGTFAFSFYIANIGGSYKSAKRHNETKLKSLSNKFQYSFNY